VPQYAGLGIRIRLFEAGGLIAAHGARDNILIVTAWLTFSGDFDDKRCRNPYSYTYFCCCHLSVVSVLSLGEMGRAQNCECHYSLE
jgi:hypothetical protein